jgi:hypothetical protein
MGDIFSDKEIKTDDRVSDDNEPSYQETSDYMPPTRISLTGLTLLFLAVLEGVALWLRG